MQIWSPKVSKKLAAMLLELEQERGPGLRVVMNERYTNRIQQLEEKARQKSSATDEPAFRMLQIMSRLK